MWLYIVCRSSLCCSYPVTIKFNTLEVTLRMETVLFEFKQSRRQLELDRSTICSDIDRTLAEFGINDAYVTLGGGSKPGKAIYLL